ncbi:hypothetical protein [Actinoallomurus soli]|uniref:hypothetical protein n=1 Tax=Actinoallomurus soli TaxID=2952535 RepID=UPI00209244BE|nr:hypothetical protein [Actinoallomurus soli]MCO5972671.1 hypothetical protein [Actinoallomurus soli]
MTAQRPVPVIPGFTVQEDPLTREWVAVSASGRYKIRGRGQRELEQQRWALYGRVLAEFRQAIAETWPRPSLPGSQGTETMPAS